MKRINLLKTTKKEGLFGSLTSLVPAGQPKVYIIIILIIAGLLWQLSAGLRYQRLVIYEKQRLENAQLEADTIKAQADTFRAEREKIKNEKQRLSKKILVLESCVREKIPWAKILKALSDATPEEAVLESVLLDKATAKITGNCPDNLMVSRFMTEIDKSNYFNNTTFTFTQKVKSGDADLINFEITAEIVPAKYILQKSQMILKRQ